MLCGVPGQYGFIILEVVTKSSEEKRNKNNIVDKHPENGDVLAIKEHLIDELDYILVPTEGWNKLISWYGLTENQEPIARKVVEQGMFVKHCKVEVYLTELKLCEDSNMDNVITRRFSKADTIDMIEKEMRKLFTVPDEKETRLWNRYMSNTFEPLNKPDCTIQDAGLYQGQIKSRHLATTSRRASDRVAFTFTSSSCSRGSLSLGRIVPMGPSVSVFPHSESSNLLVLLILVIEQKSEDGSWPRGSTEPKLRFFAGIQRLQQPSAGEYCSTGWSVCLCCLVDFTVPSFHHSSRESRQDGTAQDGGEEI
ncbi:Ubiquitin carboxyl-terminal hydrolase 15 [Liparis tanakae]|uniref:ubiquitinyl hydrolase 1 n=1 Tax=Liparis tanakae TaxID=230148 RepID=A0A4Z2I3N4_9TELE|nr:Ubiquitin carboxyl-terminal hydrolase 15 [Liparis tanakae]